MTAVGIWIVHSPDDGGVYLERYNRLTKEEKTSITYPTRDAAVDAMRRNAVEWEDSES